MVKFASLKNVPIIMNIGNCFSYIIYIICIQSTNVNTSRPQHVNMIFVSVYLKIYRIILNRKTSQFDQLYDSMSQLFQAFLNFFYVHHVHSFWQMIVNIKTQTLDLRSTAQTKHLFPNLQMQILVPSSCRLAILPNSSCDAALVKDSKPNMVPHFQPFSQQEYNMVCLHLSCMLWNTSIGGASSTTLKILIVGSAIYFYYTIYEKQWKLFKILCSQSADECRTVEQRNYTFTHSTAYK
ncbi:hypothetical protein AGLY_007249 [Aphis glycines]|uniref:Uncharacterized protein n=1 Tax=Aphis glycines TaxID=307491 RepID=A0A6G0TRC0_APHGL|nr:hypothetical protein AGLY_007249 [Aphis glycines]